MNMRLKMIVFVILVGVGMFCFMLAGTYIVVLRWADRGDASEARENVQRVLAAVAGELSELIAANKDYSQWNDTCNFAVNCDRAYIETNLRDDALENNRFNLFLVADAKARLVHAKAYDSFLHAEVPVPAGTMEKLAAVGALRTDGSVSEQKNGLILLAAGPFLISAQPILMNDGSGPSHGTLVIGRRLEASLFKALSSIVRLPVVFYTLGDARLEPALRARLIGLGAEDPVLAASKGGGRLEGYGVLRDLEDAPALVVSISQPAKFRSQAIALFFVFLGLFAIITIVAGVVCIRLMDVMAVSRIVRLADFTRGVRSADNLGERVALEGNDEIASLAASVNGMLDALQRESSARLLDEERLKALLDLAQMQDAPFNELSDYAIEAMVKLTGSSFGYLAIMNEDEKQLIVQAWSKQTRGESAIQDKTVTLDLQSPGPWAEAVRQRRPIIINDYSAPSPFKKGLPAGHVPIRSYMGVPIMDGERIVMVAGIANKTEPYTDSDVRQVVLLMNGMGRIVQRRKAQQELRESEERFRAAAEVTGQIVYEHFVETGRIRWAGAVTAITGYKPEEFARFGSPEYKTIIHAEDEKALQAALREAEKKDSPYRVSYRLMRADKSWVWIEDSGVFLRDAGGKPSRMLGALKDISERVQAQEDRRRYEERLRQAAKLEAVGRLAGGVAHDFNNALTGILGYTELLMGSYQPGDQMHSDLDEIRKAGERAASLTTQLLAFSRKQVIAPRVLDLNALVAESSRMLSRLIGENCELLFVPDDAPATVQVDPNQIEQVLVNLAVNARDAMPEGGRLSVKVRRAVIDETYARTHPDASVGEWILLSISDTGSGMSRENLEHLFEPFYTTKGIGKGTGLGLAMIYGMVKQNHGFINVVSEPGMGATFSIYLPFIHEVEEIVKPASPAAIPGGSEVILLVEDEAIVRTLAIKLLERKGYKVLAARDGEEALARVKGDQGRIDLLLTDMAMPATNGKLLYDKLKLLRPSLRVLFMSGYAEDTVIHGGVLEEGTAFIQKPFTMDALTRKVRDILDEEGEDVG